MKVKYISVLIISIFILSACVALNKSSSSKEEPQRNFLESEKGEDKLKICPDEWIDNQMPVVADKNKTQYFIVGRIRRELDEFDLDWVENNCELKKQIVY